MPLQCANQRSWTNKFAVLAGPLLLQVCSQIGFALTLKDKFKCPSQPKTWLTATWKTLGAREVTLCLRLTFCRQTAQFQTNVSPIGIKWTHAPLHVTTKTTRMISTIVNLALLKCTRTCMTCREIFMRMGRWWWGWMYMKTCTTIETGFITTQQVDSSEDMLLELLGGAMMKRASYTGYCRTSGPTNGA